MIEENDMKEHNVVMDTVAPYDVAVASAETRTDAADRARRLQLLQRTAGIWKDRADVPKDGLDYQREERAEWD